MSFTKLFQSNALTDAEFREGAVAFVEMPNIKAIARITNINAYGYARIEDPLGQNDFSDIQLLRDVFRPLAEKDLKKLTEKQRESIYSTINAPSAENAEAEQPEAETTEEEVILSVVETQPPAPNLAEKYPTNSNIVIMIEGRMETARVYVSRPDSLTVGYLDGIKRNRPDSNDEFTHVIGTIKESAILRVADQRDIEAQMSAYAQIRHLEEPNTPLSGWNKNSGLDIRRSVLNKETKLVNPDIPDIRKG